MDLVERIFTHQHRPGLQQPANLRMAARVKKSMITKIFPTLLIVLMIAAAFVYAKHGDARRTIYWLAAATLNIVVTW